MANAHVTSQHASPIPTRPPMWRKRGCWNDLMRRSDGRGLLARLRGAKTTLGNIVINGKSCWIPRREAPQSLKEKHPRAPSAMEQPHQKHFLLHDIPVPNRWLGVAYSRFTRYQETTCGSQNGSGSGRFSVSHLYHKLSVSICKTLSLSFTLRMFGAVLMSG